MIAVVLENVDGTESFGSAASMIFRDTRCLHIAKVPRAFF